MAGELPPRVTDDELEAVVKMIADAEGITARLAAVKGYLRAMHGSTIGSVSQVTIAPGDGAEAATITVTAGAAPLVGLSRLTLDEARELADALHALASYIDKSTPRRPPPRRG